MNQKIKNNKKKFQFREFLFTSPSLAWISIFFILPTFIFLILAFKSTVVLNIYNSYPINYEFSILFKKVYLTIIVRTVIISVISTFLCIIFAIPVGYYIMKLPDYISRLLIFCIVLPFWINFLVRIFAWKLVFSPGSVLFRLLCNFGIISDQTLLIHNNLAVILVTFYTYLPFAVLSIYSSAEKFDFKLMEAAYDLGASRLYAFLYVFIPNIISGIKSSIILVLIPSLGSYVIPELIGSTNSLLIGNIAIKQVFVDKNIPLASMWLCVLVIMILLTISLIISINFLCSYIKNKFIIAKKDI